MNINKARNIFLSKENTIQISDWTHATDDEIASFEVSDKVKKAWYFIMTTDEVEGKPLYSTVAVNDFPTEWELRDGTAE